MNRIRAIAIGAMVAVFLVGAGQIGTAADQRVALVTSAGTSAYCQELSAEIAFVLDAAKQAVARLVDF